MSVRALQERAWSDWALFWFPVLLVAAVWTAVSLPRGEIIAGLVFFSLLTGVAAGMAAESGCPVPWLVAPSAAVWLTALLGPLFGEPLPTLLVCALMTAVTPPIRGWFVRRGKGHEVTTMSDWELELRWSDSEAELRRLRHEKVHPDQALGVVLRRKELLDELLRRHRVPEA